MDDDNFVIAPRPSMQWIRHNSQEAAEEIANSTPFRIDYQAFAEAEQIYGRSVDTDDRAAYNRQVEAGEKPLIDKFFATGVAGRGRSRLDIFATRSGLQVIGERLNGEKVLFVIDTGRIVANKRRCGHIKKKLMDLAARENLELKFTDMTLGAEIGIPILFWPFKNREEADDTALFTVAPTRPLTTREALFEQRLAPNMPVDDRGVRWEDLTVNDLPF